MARQLFWEELIIESMSIPVKMWLHARRQGEAGSYLELKRMITLAIYRELKRQGEADSDILEIMGCGTSTLRRCKDGLLSSDELQFYELLRETISLVEGQNLRREAVVEQIVARYRGPAGEGARRGSRATQDALERIRRSVWKIIDIYVERGLFVEDSGSDALSLKSKPDLRVTHIVRVEFLGRRILAHLSAVGRADRGQLLAYCERLRPDWGRATSKLLDRALREFIDHGLIHEQPSEHKPTYTSAEKPHYAPGAREPNYRRDLYTRAPDLFRGVADFIDLALTAGPETPARRLLSQRVMHFDTTPEALEAFVNQLSHEHGLLIPSAVALDRHADPLPQTQDPFDKNGNPKTDRKIRASLLWMALPWRRGRS